MNIRADSLPIGGHTIFIRGQKAIAEVHRKALDLGEIRYLAVGTQDEVLTVQVRIVSGGPSDLVFFDPNFWVVQIDGKPTHARSLQEVVQIAGAEVGFNADPNLGTLNFITRGVSR